VTVASFDGVQRPLSVLIAGAGIAGPALAYWLNRRGHRPVLVERLDRRRVGGHAVDIRGTALEVVDRMGVGKAARDARTRILTLSAVRPDGRRTYDVALRPLHEARGDREIEIMRDDLVSILLDAVTDDVDVVFGDAIRAVTQGETSVGVEFDQGSSREFDLVVGADGQHSALRELAFGPENDYIRHLGAYLSIYTIDNLLNLSDQAVLYNEPGRGAAAFTAHGNARAKVVLMFRSGRIGIDYADRRGQQDLLRRRFAGMGWETPRLLAALDGAHDFYFDEMAQVRMPRWSSGRIALLGDAAFGPSPMSGQGTSLALIGGYLLAHQLDSASNASTAFDRWENAFRATVEENQRLAGDGLGVLLPGSRLGIAVRNQTMRALPAMARFGLGFGGQIERASRSVTLPDG
jgi:2-polyprenyl-6-methoxyphenol hydroxylase-like FAD-dependent oxidoreductase